MAHRLAAQAERDLDEIWLYVAKESASIDVANRLIDTITGRCVTIGKFPSIGRRRDEDLGPEYRSLSVGEYVIIYRFDDDSVLILRVVHGRRDLEALFGR